MNKVRKAMGADRLYIPHYKNFYFHSSKIGTNRKVLKRRMTSYALIGQLLFISIGNISIKASNP